MDGAGINTVDIVALGILLLSGLLAFARGLVREVLSVAGWVGAAVIAIQGLPYAQPFVKGFIPDDTLANVVTGGALFVIGLIVLSMLSHAIAGQIRNSTLNAVDRSLGFLFGLLRGGVLVCLAYLILTWVYSDLPQVIREARTLPMVQRGADHIQRLLPERFRRRGYDPATSNSQANPSSAPPQLGVQELAVPPPRQSSPTPQPEGYNDNSRTDMDKLLETTR